MLDIDKYKKFVQETLGHKISRIMKKYIIKISNLISLLFVI